MPVDDKKTGVLLLAFGGADSLENVGAFVENVLKGRPVTPEVIEKARARYDRIGGSSPILDITRKQAAALEKLLNEASPRYKTYVGMRYWHPYIKDTIKQMYVDGVEEAVAVIMAPHSSRAATGGYHGAVDEALKKTGGVPEIKFIDGWHTHPLYIQAVVETLDEAAGKIPSGTETLVIFSAHSLPEPAILAGDDYVKKLNETIAEVVKTRPVKWRLGFQSKGGGAVKWLSPEVEEIMREAAAGGVKAALVVPIGFVSDHVETLYDIDVAMKDAARAIGIGFYRAPSLNLSEKFIAALADTVLRGAGKAK